MTVLNSYIIVFGIPAALAICCGIIKEESLIEFEQKVRAKIRERITAIARQLARNFS